MNTGSLLAELERKNAEFIKLGRHLLGLKNPGGFPLINAELFFLQLLEDWEASRWVHKAYTPADLMEHLRVGGEERVSPQDAGDFFLSMYESYRYLVCGLGSFDWLCGPAGLHFFTPDYPVYVYDRTTCKNYIFAIRYERPPSQKQKDS